MLEKIPGDQNITKLFGFPGYEAMLVTMVKHLNIVRQKAGLAKITYAKFITEVEAEMASITEKSA